MTKPDENERPSGPVEGAETGTDSGTGEGTQRERRVVRKRRKRKSDSGRQTLYLKKMEILRDMEGDSEQVGIKEQVERLKAARKEEVPVEDKWGSSSHRRRGSRWVIFAVLGLAIPIIAALVLYTLMKGRPGTMAGDQSLVLDLDRAEEEIAPFDRTSPVAWFHEHSVEAFEEAQELMEKWNEATNPAELQDVLRDGARVSRLLSIPEMQQTPDYMPKDMQYLKWEYGSADGTGFMVVTGRRTDFSPFRAYFVKTADGLRLDWEATSTQSEIPIGKLVQEAPSAPVLVRCWLGKQPYFDTERGPAASRSWYIILDAAKAEFVWACAPVKSQLDERLRDLLSYGRMVENREEEVRATVRLSKPGGTEYRENEFEIAELVTEDWVAP